MALVLQERVVELAERRGDESESRMPQIMVVLIVVEENGADACKGDQD